MLLENNRCITFDQIKRRLDSTFRSLKKVHDVPRTRKSTIYIQKRLALKVMHLLSSSRQTIHKSTRNEVQVFLRLLDQTRTTQKYSLIAIKKTSRSNIHITPQPVSTLKSIFTIRVPPLLVYHYNQILTTSALLPPHSSPCFNKFNHRRHQGSRSRRSRPCRRSSLQSRCRIASRPSKGCIQGLPIEVCSSHCRFRRRK